MPKLRLPVIGGIKASFSQTMRSVRGRLRGLRRRKQIDLIDLGAGSTPTLLRELSDKSNRKLAAIDHSYSSLNPAQIKHLEGISLNKKSSVKIVPGKIEEKIPSEPNSVRNFRMNLVLSTLWERPTIQSGHGKITVFEEIARKAHNALVPGGRFQLIDFRHDAREAVEVLKKAGFDVSIWPMDESVYKRTQTLSGWSRQYISEAKEKVISGQISKKEDSIYWPWKISAVKRVPK